MKPGYLILSSLGCFFIFLSCFTPAKLIVNLTPSAPLGLYWVQKNGSFSVDDWIVFHLEESLLIKQVVGQSGDMFCMSESKEFLVNGKSYGYAMLRDKNEKRLLSLKGCKKLQIDEWVLWGRGERSFDSRYFGSIHTRQVLGKVLLMLSRSS